jgi:gliding motility-associated-like protein
MRYLIKTLILIFCCLNAFAAPPSNDDFPNAINLDNTAAFCSSDGQFNNVDATPSSAIPSPISWNGNVGRDVWFKFTATKFDVNISISGHVDNNTLSTLSNPLVALYIDNGNGINEEIVSITSSNNVTSLYKSNLTIGTTYFIRVSAQNNAQGTFKLCIDNYFPPILPGQDCSSSSVLCTKDTFTQLNVVGAGINRNEADGTCLTQESNSAWYKFTAKTAGSLTFTITPSVSSDDIDWALFDLGVGGDCNNIIPANVIRCAAGSGVTCTPSYFKTGLSLTETDLNEGSGCPLGANGFLKFVDMEPGHVYALLINNFSSGNNGFTLEFGGTGEFVGPKADIKLTEINPCTDNQSFTFESISENYTSLEWDFGQGASMQTATTEGPFNITYSTLGEKVIVLRAKSNTTCSDVIATKKIFVTKKPEPPEISINKTLFCINDVIELKTEQLENVTYTWTGPDGFTANTATVTIPVNNINKAGRYELIATSGSCNSDVASIDVPTIFNTPVANFSISPGFINKYSVPINIQFNNLSQFATNYQWDFGDGETSIEITPLHTYTKPGTYQITLNAFNENNCANEITKGSLIIFPQGYLLLPNSFTPNGDGINDELIIGLTNLLKYKIQIVNRLGSIIFQTNNIFENWNGKYQNKDMPTGVYYYMITGVDVDNRTIKNTGSITLIR